MSTTNKPPLPENHFAAGIFFENPIRLGLFADMSTVDWSHYQQLLFGLDGSISPALPSKLLSCTLFDKDFAIIRAYHLPQQNVAAATLGAASQRQKRSRRKQTLRPREQLTPLYLLQSEEFVTPQFRPNENQSIRSTFYSARGPAAQELFITCANSLAMQESAFSSFLDLPLLCDETFAFHFKHRFPAKHSLFPEIQVKDFAECLSDFLSPMTRHLPAWKSHLACGKLPGGITLNCVIESLFDPDLAKRKQLVKNYLFGIASEPHVLINLLSIALVHKRIHTATDGIASLLAWLAADLSSPAVSSDIPNNRQIAYNGISHHLAQISLIIESAWEAIRTVLETNDSSSLMSFFSRSRDFALSIAGYGHALLCAQNHFNTVNGDPAYDRNRLVSDIARILGVLLPAPVLNNSD